MKLPAWLLAVSLGALLAAPAARGDAEPEPGAGAEDHDQTCPDCGRKKAEPAEAAPPADEPADPVEATRKIIDMMREVEDRLAEADADAFTQRQQQKIVDALDLGDDAVVAIQRLIERLDGN